MDLTAILIFLGWYFGLPGLAILMIWRGRRRGARGGGWRLTGEGKPEVNRRPVGMATHGDGKGQPNKCCVAWT